MEEPVFRLGEIVSAVTGGITTLGLLITIWLNSYSVRAKRQENDPWRIGMREDVKHIREKVDDQGLMLTRLDEEARQTRERIVLTEHEDKAQWKKIDDHESRIRGLEDAT